jgi:hypothetical protein
MSPRFSHDAPQPHGPGESRHPGDHPDESILRQGAGGIIAVTLATLTLAAAGALIALVVSLVY